MFLYRFTQFLGWVVVLTHFILMFMQIGLSVSGIIALTCLLSIAGLGAYGAFLSRDNREKWLVWPIAASPSFWFWPSASISSFTDRMMAPCAIGSGVRKNRDPSGWCGFPAGDMMDA